MLLEIRDSNRISGVLPVQLKMAEWGRPVGAGGAGFWGRFKDWRPLQENGEIVLEPWLQSWDHKADKLGPMQPDSRFRLRLGQQEIGPPILSPLPRLDSDWSAAVSELTGKVVQIEIHPGGAVHEIRTVPVRVETARLDGGRLVLRGQGGFWLEVTADRCMGLRQWDGEWIIDLWADECGYGPSVHVYGQRVRQEAPQAPRPSKTKTEESLSGQDKPAECAAQKPAQAILEVGRDERNRKDELPVLERRQLTFSF